MERRARAYLPATVTGPGTMTLVAEEGSGQLRVQFDDETLHEIGVPPSPAERRIRFELPSDRLRAYARLRFESTTEGGELRLGAVEWSSKGAMPQRRLLWASAFPLLGPFLGVLAVVVRENVGAIR